MQLFQIDLLQFPTVPRVGAHSWMFQARNKYIEFQIPSKIFVKTDAGWSLEITGSVIISFQNLSSKRNINFYICPFMKHWMQYERLFDYHILISQLDVTKVQSLKELIQNKITGSCTLDILTN